jgi:hypothetical protein
VGVQGRPVSARVSNVLCVMCAPHPLHTAHFAVCNVHILLFDPHSPPSSSIYTLQLPRGWGGVERGQIVLVRWWRWWCGGVMFLYMDTDEDDEAHSAGGARKRKNWEASDR